MTYKLADWGKSMYGGYYANYYVCEPLSHGGFEIVDIDGIHADTYRELRDVLALYGLKAVKARRFDNI